VSFRGKSPLIHSRWSAVAGEFDLIILVVDFTLRKKLPC
jgi:hypothetical protein